MMKLYGYFLGDKENGFLPVLYKDGNEYYIQCIKEDKIIMFNNTKSYSIGNEIIKNATKIKADINKTIGEDAIYVLRFNKEIIIKYSRKDMWDYINKHKLFYEHTRSHAQSSHGDEQ